MDKSDNSFKKVGCQAVYGVYAGYVDGQVFSGPIRCGRWSCEFCSDLKVKKIRRRMIDGEISSITKYGLKMATLTFGGMDAREPFVIKNSVTGKPLTTVILDKHNQKKTVCIYDAKAMYEEMMKAFNKLRTALVKRFGKFHYFRIHEPHLDGVPHLHVLFAGKNIVPKSFLDVITKLWAKYGLGFVKLNAIRDKHGKLIKKFNDAQHAVNYLLKYMTKGVKTAGPYKRAFSSSRGALKPIEKKEWERMEIIFGSVEDNGNVVEEVLFKDTDRPVIHGLAENEVVLWDESPFLRTFDAVGMTIDRHLQHQTRRKLK